MLRKTSTSIAGRLAVGEERVSLVADSRPVGRGGSRGFVRTPFLAPKRFYIHCYSTFLVPYRSTSSLAAIENYRCPSKSGCSYALDSMFLIHVRFSRWPSLLKSGTERNNSGTFRPVPPTKIRNSQLVPPTGSCSLVCCETTRHWKQGPLWRGNTFLPAGKL